VNSANSNKNFDLKSHIFATVKTRMLSSDESGVMEANSLALEIIRIGSDS
jgi:hypothetical protein